MIIQAYFTGGKTEVQRSCVTCPREKRGKRSRGAWPAPHCDTQSLIARRGACHWPEQEPARLRGKARQHPHEARQQGAPLEIPRRRGRRTKSKCMGQLSICQSAKVRTVVRGMGPSLHPHWGVLKMGE